MTNDDIMSILQNDNNNEINKHTICALMFKCLLQTRGLYIIT